MRQVSTWEEEKNQLEAQLSAAIEKSNDLVAEKFQLQEALDETAWKDEKEQLIDALEEEKDKVKTRPKALSIISLYEELPKYKYLHCKGEL